MDYFFRVGQGYDVHRLVDGHPLILGGVTIPFGQGLDGHSDADVLTHAVMDALLGAAGLNDIGTHFPDSQAYYKNISSLLLLEKLSVLLKHEGWSVSNIDTTVIAQKPKLSDFRSGMAKNLAAALEIEPGKVNVKATTEEGLGFTGQGLGIAANAVCLIYKK